MISTLNAMSLTTIDLSATEATPGQINQAKNEGAFYLRISDIKGQNVSLRLLKEEALISGRY
jgi:hypothetical protein